jgi:hypothetical protein
MKYIEAEKLEALAEQLDPERDLADTEGWLKSCRGASTRLRALIASAQGEPPGDGGLREMLARIEGLAASLDKSGMYSLGKEVRGLPLGLCLNALGRPAQTYGDVLIAGALDAVASFKDDPRLRPPASSEASK